MAKLYFRYGAMNSGKSLDLLAVNHVYEEQGKKTLLFKPAIDTRSNYIESRIGVKKSCYKINIGFNIEKYINNYVLSNKEKIDCILVDEAQFLTEEHVKQLSNISYKLDIPVICYGLKNTYIDGELFSGSKTLLYYADRIEEIKTTCELCNKKATMNLRVVNGIPVYNGDAIEIGDIKGENRYLSLCKEHYYNYNKK